MTKRVNLTMHEDYWNKLQMLADRAGVSPSEKVRKLITDAWASSPFREYNEDFIVEQRGKDFSPAKFREECEKRHKAATARETLPDRAYKKRGHGKKLPRLGKQPTDPR